jgi:hypothetical protein
VSLRAGCGPWVAAEDSRHYTDAANKRTLTIEFTFSGCIGACPHARVVYSDTRLGASASITMRLEDLPPLPLKIICNKMVTIFKYLLTRVVIPYIIVEILYKYGVNFYANYEEGARGFWLALRKKP